MTAFIEETTSLLRRTPEVLRTLLVGLPDSWTDTTDVPEHGWRPHDVVGHLITGELTDWIDSLGRCSEGVCPSTRRAVSRSVTGSPPAGREPRAPC